MLLLLASLLLGCGPRPVDPAVIGPHVAGVPRVLLHERRLYLDQDDLGWLEAPGVLRRNRHGKLQDALMRLAGLDPETVKADEESGPNMISEQRPLHVVLPALTPFSLLYNILATGAWAGFGDFRISVEGTEGVVGSVFLSMREPPLWNGEPIMGVLPDLGLSLMVEQVSGTARFDVGVLAPTHAAGGVRGGESLEPRMLPSLLRLMGTVPLVDCATVFAGHPDLLSVCNQGQTPDPKRVFTGPPPPSLLPGGPGLGLGAANGCLAGTAGPSLLPEPRHAKDRKHVPPPKKKKPKKPREPGVVVEFDPPLAQAPIDAIDPDPSWRSQLAASLGALGLDDGASVVLSVDPDVSAARLLATLQAFTDAGLPLPAISSQVPQDADPGDCKELVVDAAGLDAAGALWLGEQRNVVPKTAKH